MGGPPENWYSHRSKPGDVPGGGPSRPPYCGEGDNLWGLTGATRQSGDGGSTPPISTIARPCDTPHSLRAPWTPAPRGAQPGPATSQAGPLTNPERSADMARRDNARAARALAEWALEGFGRAAADQIA